MMFDFSAGTSLICEVTVENFVIQGRYLDYNCLLKFHTGMEKINDWCTISHVALK